MATIEILGVSHAYDLTPPRKQASPVLVFIHGWLLSRQYWRPLIEDLSSDYRCLSYDLRGFGDSSTIAELADLSSGDTGVERSCESREQVRSALDKFTLAAYARDLQVLLQKLSIEQAWLVGHSLGGSIALWGAEFCRERIQGVICLNSGGGIYLKEEFERFRQVGQQLVKQRPRWLPYVPLIDLLFARAMVARPLARHWGRQRVIDFLKADTQAALGSLLESTTEAEVHLLPQVVSQLQQPVYFLAGAQDTVMEPKYVSHLASFHPLFGNCGDNVIEIPNCGHLSMVEQPSKVAKIIREILSTHQ